MTQIVWSLYKCSVCDHRFKIEFEISVFEDTEPEGCPICFSEKIDFIRDKEAE